MKLGWTMCLLIGLGIAGCGGSPPRLAGTYKATPLFGNKVKDREALGLIDATTLTLQDDNTFKLKMANTDIAGTWDVSGRLLTLHLGTVDGVEASKAPGAEISVLNQVYEVRSDAKTLSWANAEPGSAAMKFERQTP